MQRDYVSRGSTSRRGQQKNTGRKKLLLTLIFVIIAVFVVALFFLKENSPASKQITAKSETVTATKKSTLPSRPEEVWSYIKQLETREVPVDDNLSSIAQNVQLTEEQKKILWQLEQDKLAEQAKRKADMQARTEQAKLQQQAKSKNDKVKAVVVEAKAESESKKKTAVTETKNGKKYGLQCGAFKNKTQAEHLQGRLVIAGFNAFTKSSADWSRVLVGPVDSYNSASAAKSTLASKGIDCVVIGM